MVIQCLIMLRERGEREGEREGGRGKIGRGGQERGKVPNVIS